MNGSENVNAMKGGWEIIWKKDAPAGSLVAGFEIDRDYQRNAATLEKGEGSLKKDVPRSSVIPLSLKALRSYIMSSKKTILAYLT